MFYWQCESDWLSHQCLLNVNMFFLKGENYAQFLTSKIYTIQTDGFGLQFFRVLHNRNKYTTSLIPN